MTDTLTCWKCSATLKDVILPMSRREECSQCAADQHVCKMCRHFDGRRYCNEDRAEAVSDPEKANFCDYFAPSGKVFEQSQTDKSAAAKAQLAALFGEALAPQETTDTRLTPAQIAEKKLRDLLG